MPRANRRPARAHALRIDLPSILQGGIAAIVSFLVAWLILRV
jgi:hypothetical protein